MMNIHQRQSADHKSFFACFGRVCGAKPPARRLQLALLVVFRLRAAPHHRLEALRCFALPHPFLDLVPLRGSATFEFQQLQQGPSADAAHARRVSAAVVRDVDFERDASPRLVARRCNRRGPLDNCRRADEVPAGAPPRRKRFRRRPAAVVGVLSTFCTTLSDSEESRP